MQQRPLFLWRKTIPAGHPDRLLWPVPSRSISRFLSCAGLLPVMARRAARSKPVVILKNQPQTHASHILGPRQSLRKSGYYWCGDRSIWFSTHNRVPWSVRHADAEPSSAVSYSHRNCRAVYSFPGVLVSGRPPNRPCAFVRPLSVQGVLAVHTQQTVANTSKISLPWRAGGTESRFPPLSGNLPRLPRTAAVSAKSAVPRPDLVKPANVITLEGCK